LAAFTLSSVAEASLVVIANPSLKINALTKNQLADLYLNKPVSLPVTVTPYNQPDNTLSYQEFYQQILGWDAEQVSSYWAQQVFSGFSQQPSAVNNDQAAIQLVEKDPSAIAFVDSESLKNVGHRVKVVYGNYKIPAASAPTSSGQLYSSSSTNGYMTAISNSDPASDASTDIQGPTSDPDASLAKQLTSINNGNSGGQSQNIWSLIQSHMTLQAKINDPRVQHWILWFSDHPKVLNTMINNAVPYLYYVYHQTQSRNMPGEFALLPMIESGYNPRAYSSAGAAGLWQLMPGTASSYGMEIDWWYDARRDVLTSTNAGLNYLVHLHRVMNTWALAAAAYNVGPGALEASIHRNKSEGKPADYWDLQLPNQTENYVPKLLAISAIIADPAKYHIQLPYVPNRPFFASVTLTSQMDLNEISKFSSVSIPVLKSLNPGLQRWATAPNGNFTLLLPATSVGAFENNLQKVIGQKHVGWIYHQVTNGESLATIASKYDTSMSKLAKVNNLHSGSVKVGSAILVPVKDSVTYTKLAGVSGAVSMQSQQERVLSNALKRAAASQDKGLPAEVTGEPIEPNENLKSLLGKLYGSD
ncbi:MAG: transglycosylase SLT domain-containing protein, partial [Coxiellaceae bacterium]|nr:transglycosylase SLT domain-containing protein [Coxiellaceae bacterium]